MIPKHIGVQMCAWPYRPLMDRDTFSALSTEYTQIHTYIHTCIHAYIHAYIHTYIHTCMHAYIHTYVHICKDILFALYVRDSYMHTCIHAYIHAQACMHTYMHECKRTFLALCVQGTYLHTHIRTYIHAFTRKHTPGCVYVQNTHTYTCMLHAYAQRQISCFMCTWYTLSHTHTYMHIYTQRHIPCLMCAGRDDINGLYNFMDASCRSSQETVDIQNHAELLAYFFSLLVTDS
jgi:hypothetical protein